MPKPPTFTDSEVLKMISEFFVGNSRFPTISEVKKMGCGDTRAQRLLREAKGLPDDQPQPQPQPKQPYPPMSASLGKDMIVDDLNRIWVNTSALPPWMTKRVLDWMTKEVRK